MNQLLLTLCSDKCFLRRFRHWAFGKSFLIVAAVDRDLLRCLLLLFTHRVIVISLLAHVLALSLFDQFLECVGTDDRSVFIIRRLAGFNIWINVKVSISMLLLLLDSSGLESSSLHMTHCTGKLVLNLVDIKICFLERVLITSLLSHPI